MTIVFSALLVRGIQGNRIALSAAGWFALFQIFTLYA
jgi:hypothetical protein